MKSHLIVKSQFIVKSQWNLLLVIGAGAMLVGVLFAVQATRELVAPEPDTAPRDADGADSQPTATSEPETSAPGTLLIDGVIDVASDDGRTFVLSVGAEDGVEPGMVFLALDAQRRGTGKLVVTGVQKRFCVAGSYDIALQPLAVGDRVETDGRKVELIRTPPAGRGVPAAVGSVRSTVEALRDGTDRCIVRAGWSQGVAVGMKFHVKRRGERVAIVVIDRVLEHASAAHVETGSARNLGAIVTGDDVFGPLPE